MMNRDFREWTWAIWLGLFAMILGLVLALDANATTIIPPSNADLANSSDVIAVVKVGQIESVDSSSGINTAIQLTVDEPVVGAAAGQKIVIQERGGRVGEKQSWVFDSPTFKTGDRVLVFLKANKNGVLSTNVMKYGVVPVSGVRGATLARIRQTNIPLASIKSMRSARVETMKTFPAPMLVGAAQVNPDYKLMQPPSKWEQMPIEVLYSNEGEALIGLENSRLAFNQALMGWAVDPGSSIDFTVIGSQPGTGFQCIPGKLTISFEDPKGEIADPVNCTGVLAVGGFCAGGQIPGSPYRGINGGSIVFNNGWSGCHYWTAQNYLNLTEVLTHELGHALGFAHSCESGEAGCDSVHQAATMYWMAHFDQRGALVKQYDVGVEQLLYGSGATPSPTTQPTPSQTPIRTPRPTPTMTPTMQPPRSTWLSTRTPIPIQTRAPGPFSGCTQPKKVGP